MTTAEIDRYLKGNWQPMPATPVTITTDHTDYKFDTGLSNRLTSASNSYTAVITNPVYDPEELAKLIQEKLEKQYILERRPIDMNTYKGAPLVALKPGRNAAFLMDDKEIIELKDICGIEIEQKGGWCNEIELRVKACKMDITPVSPYGIIKDKPQEIKPSKMKLEPVKTIFNGPATTIIWNDGTKTTVKCQPGDEFDKEKGILCCYMKRLFNNHGNYNNIFRKAMAVAEDQNKIESVTISTANSETYYASALENMKENIQTINDVMENAKKVLGEALKAAYKEGDKE